MSEKARRSADGARDDERSGGRRHSTDQHGLDGAADRLGAFTGAKPIRSANRVTE
ncbi:hypothetical protein [Candidatus Amarolinea dominans]|uniref:hypothetical protein n=1 Tax=Candidatus Amarolinea dominans TaxID=3140696 RepID=UPI001D566DE1|nr:hypothetical protein [Anaerolineae bacterium]